MPDAPSIGAVCQKPVNDHSDVDELSAISWASGNLLSSIDPDGLVIHHDKKCKIAYNACTSCAGKLLI